MILLLRLVWRQAKRYPARFSVAMLLSVGVACLWVAEPLYSSYAIDQLLTLREGKELNYWFLFGVWAGLFVLLSLGQAIEKYSFWELDNRLLLDRREDVYRHVLHLGIGFHTQQKSGEIIKQLDEGADSLVDLQRSILLELGPSFLSAFAFLIIGFTIEPRLAAVLVCTLTLYAGIVVIGTHKTAKLQYAVNRFWVESIGRAFDAATNIFSVQSGAQEEREMIRMRASHAKAIATQQKVNVRWAMIEAINFFMLTRMLLIGFGIMLYIWGELTLGELYFFQFSFFRVLVPFEMLAGLLPQWNKKVGKIRMSEMILEHPIAIKRTEGSVIPKELKGEIVLDHACFAYAPVPVIVTDDDVVPSVEPETQCDCHEDELPDYMEHLPEDESNEHLESLEEAVHDAAEQKQEDTRSAASHKADVLHDITLTIRPGEQLAFVGHSGAGKSTMVSLFNRFYDVTEGRILIDGTDLRDMDVHWWRSQIGLVLQENIMFNDSILENIRYARPDATEADVREAAKRAAAAEFIESLPLGYKTLIGDRGIRLSGGQRQRVAIARAILKQPKIVILDEATSALDSKTEVAVQEGIRELIAGRTSIIIAHRLSTVRAVDRIAVLDKGRLIACAPHNELVRTCPIYKEMVELQSNGMLAE